MPKYVYSCNACNTEFEAYHGMRDKMDYCVNCDQKDCVVRITHLTNVIRKYNTGNQVKEAIEENKNILKQMKKEALKDR